MKSARTLNMRKDLSQLWSLANLYTVPTSTRTDNVRGLGGKCCGVWLFLPLVLLFEMVVRAVAVCAVGRVSWC